jgi:hypothetical protein
MIEATVPNRSPEGDFTCMPESMFPGEAATRRSVPCRCAVDAPSSSGFGVGLNTDAEGVSGAI